MNASSQRHRLNASSGMRQLDKAMQVTITLWLAGPKSQQHRCAASWLVFSSGFSSGFSLGARPLVTAIPLRCTHLSPHYKSLEFGFRARVPCPSWRTFKVARDQSWVQSRRMLTSAHPAALSGLLHSLDGGPRLRITASALDCLT